METENPANINNTVDSGQNIDNMHIADKELDECAKILKNNFPNDSINDIIDNDTKFQQLKELYEENNIKIQKQSNNKILFIFQNGLRATASDIDNNAIQFSASGIQKKYLKNHNNTEDEDKWSAAQIALLVTSIIIILLLTAGIIYFAIKYSQNNDQKKQMEERTAQQQKENTIDSAEKPTVNTDPKTTIGPSQNETKLNQNNQEIKLETTIPSQTNQGMNLTNTAQQAMKLETNPNDYFKITLNNGNTINIAKNIQVNNGNVYYNVGHERQSVSINSISTMSGNSFGDVSKEVLNMADKLSPNNSGGIDFSANCYTTVQIPNNHTAIFNFKTNDGTLIATKTFENLSADSSGNFYNGTSRIDNFYSNTLNAFDKQLDQRYILTSDENMISLTTIGKEQEQNNKI